MHPVFRHVGAGLLATLLVCPVGHSQARWEYFGYGTIACVEASSDTVFVGTDKGLVLIDKKTKGFRALNKTNSPLPSNHIHSLARDHANRLWIGTNQGVIRYDDWLNVRPSSNGYIAFDRNGQLWVTEESLGSVGVYDGSTWTEYLVGPNPGPIAVDSAGAVWVQSYYFSGAREPELRVALKRFNGVTRDSVRVFGGIIRSLVADTSSIIIASPAGVQRFDGTGWHPLSLPFPDPALAWSLSLDPLNQLWVGCTDGKLFGSDSSGWKEVLTATSGTVATITFSRDTVFVGSGNAVNVLHGGERELWAASEYDFPPGQFRVLTTNSRGKISAAYDDRFGSTNLYVAGYALDSWGVDTVSSLKGIGVYDMAVGANDVLWVASAGGGLVKVDHGIETQWKYPTTGIPTNSVFNVAVEKTGAVWCSTDKVSQFDGSSWTTYSSANGVFPGNTARDIAIDSANNVWVSFPTSGIAKYDQQGHWSFRTLSDLGISSMIMCLNAAPNGDLWVGSFTTGLLRIRNNIVTLFSTVNSGIPSNQIYDISFGNDGTVWFTSSAGMSCFDGVVFSTFSPANSPLESIDYDAQIVADGVGNVWINNAGGLLRYQYLVPTGVLDRPSRQWTPSAVVLHGSYPNPFNPSTTIRYELPASSYVKVSVLDLLGREVAVLVDERKDSGIHEVKFDGSGLSSGVYFCRLQAGGFVRTQKLVLLQ